jgi:DNA-binding beta-propeller fold protein YncE
MKRALDTFLMAIATWGISGCFTDEQSLAPAPDQFYYPTGVVVSPGRTTLYVANSDFDLQYSGGWVQTLDLRRIRERARRIADNLAAGVSTTDTCAGENLQANPDPWLNPGPCSFAEMTTLVKSHAFVGAFASGALLVHEPNGNRARLFVSVRGDPSITYFDVEDDRLADGAFQASFLLDCKVGGDGFCAPEHRLGQDREGTLRGIQLPPDPVGLAATADGRAIVAAHQTQASTSLLNNDWATVPELVYFLSDLAPGPTEVAQVPEPTFAAELNARPDSGFTYRPAFVLTFRASPEIDVLRFVADSGSIPPRPFVVRASSIAVSTNSPGFDSRGVAVIDSERRACEQACGTPPDPTMTLSEEYRECLIECAENTPLRLYMANRTPPSILVGRIRTLANRAEPNGNPTGAFEELFFHDNLPLDFGPSRVEVGQVVASDGTLQERVFIVCFDSRSIFVLDPSLDRIESVVRTGRGPHDIAIDSGVDDAGKAYSYLLVGHFTDSYLGVVDLDMRRSLTYGQMIATVGEPTPPKESESESE